MKKEIKKLHPLFLIIGVVLLAFLIHKIGLDPIVNNIAALGWWFVPVLAVSFIWYILYTKAWQKFLQRLNNGIGFWDLFRIKMAGEAVNTLTPANFLGGDPLRIHLLKKNFHTTEGTASVIVDRTLHSTATLIVIILGIVVSFVTLKRLPDNIQYGVPIATIVAVLFMAFILIHQHKGFFSLVMDLSRRFGIKRTFSEKTIEHFEELDSHIMDFYRANRRGFLLALLYHTLGRLLGIVEIYAVGKFVSADFTLLASIVLCILAPIINAVFTFIPGALGVMEGAYSGTLYLLHLDPSVGLTIQIFKRIRAILWIALGLVFLGTHDREKVWKEELIEEV